MSIGYFQWTKIGCFRWTWSGCFRRTLTRACRLFFQTAGPFGCLNYIVFETLPDLLGDTSQQVDSFCISLKN